MATPIAAARSRPRCARSWTLEHWNSLRQDAQAPDGRFPTKGRTVRTKLERFPFERNRSNDKKSLKIKMLEQALIEKVYQLFQSLL